MKNLFQKAVTYLLYPAMLGGLIVIVYCAIHYHWEYQKTYGLTTLAMISIFITVEYIFPLKREWQMTGKSFLRDLKYIAVDATVIGLSKAGFGILAIWYSERHTGLFTHANPWAAGLAYLIVFEFFQYWYHRLSHEAGGKTGRFLWRVHVAHHLPNRVYVVMHAVFNPLNAFVTVIILQTPLILLGVPPEVAFVASLLVDLQTLISHFNADIRAGFLNYFLIGTELHRYHHSADTNDAKNFGSVLTLWDIIFGTFRYRPGIHPEKLGVAEPENYPAAEEVLRVIGLPFAKNQE